MRGLLGYMHNELRGYPVESLTSMRVAFPSGDRASAGFAFEFLQWLITERKCSPYYELCAVRAFIAAAKFLHGGGLQEHGDLDRPYDHVPLIRQLRKIAKETGRRAAVATPAADTRKKWLTWEQFMNVVATLEVECRPVNRTYAAGKKDLSPRSIAWVVQRYLIFGILSCIPDRQRTIRELEIGRTLGCHPHQTSPSCHQTSPGRHQTSLGCHPPLRSRRPRGGTPTDGSSATGLMTIRRGRSTGNARPF